MLRQRGFTLIELSIVLVIVGLIVGGLLVGKDLIRSAEIKAVMNGKEKIIIAMNTYKLKYNTVPGDDAKARNFFGNSVYYGTGNGNFDGGEIWYFWQHLGAAGLIEGSYTGLPGPVHGWNSIIGTNVPSSPKTGIGYSIYPATAIGSNMNMGADPRRNAMNIGTDNSPEDNQTWGGWLTAQEAFQVDVKFDDSVASTGTIRTHVNWAGHNIINCTTGATPNFDWNLAANGTCSIFYNFDP